MESDEMRLDDEPMNIEDIEEKKIPMLVESESGHDKVEVPQDEIEAQVRKELEKDNFVSLEKKDGNTEILTKKDLPDDSSDNAEWAEKFKNVESAVSTKAIKGG